MIDRRMMIAAIGATAALAPFTRSLAQDAAAAPKRDWTRPDPYSEENAGLVASSAPVGIVFLGDSITLGWKMKRPEFFHPGRVCRGVPGQATPQLLHRMTFDVVALKPRCVHIMGGTNDIAGNSGPMTTAQTCDNLRAMVALAKANGIEVLLAAIPPTARFGWRPEIADPVTPIREINAWIAANAVLLGATFVDYTPVLATPEGALRPEFGPDGVHPNKAGYDAMANVVEPLLQARGV